MPLLDLEPVRCPENLFEPTTPGLRHWSVFQTRPRAEKAFARFLLKSKVSYFLPQYVRCWRNKGRRFESALPLFPGYIFLNGAGPAREVAFASKQVVREIPVPDQNRLDHELRSIDRLLGGDATLSLENTIGYGTPVLIVDGIYAGVTGRVVEGAGAETVRVFVEVGLLGCGVSVEVDRWMVRIL